MFENKCLTPGIDFPAAIIVGPAKSGKTTLAKALSISLGLPFLETQTVAEELLGSTVEAAMNLDSEATLQTLAEASLQLVRQGGSGAGHIVALSSSSPLDEDVQMAIQTCRENGVKVIALETPMSTLIQRTGLNAARSPALGTPRAWFRAQLQDLTNAYEQIADEWCDTGINDVDSCRDQIEAILRLDS